METNEKTHDFNSIKLFGQPQHEAREIGNDGQAAQ
jgi:hypothetical protein